MKNIDSEIEQFEKNLNEIESMGNNISELSSSLEKIVKETEDIEKLKDGIKKEIESMNEVNETNTRLVNSKIRELDSIATKVKESVDNDTNKIVGVLATIKTNQETLEKKLLISYIINIVGFITIILIIIIMLLLK